MNAHTVNAHGVDPRTVTQAHADRVAAALGLAGADRIGCGGFLLGISTGRLTLTEKPFHPAHPDIVTVPWALVAGLGEPVSHADELAVPRAMLEQVYGMAREGCDVPGAAHRWCERIDLLFHMGEPSDEFEDWAEELPEAMTAIRNSRTPNEAGHG